MSLDVDLMVIQPVSIFSFNITHNLGKMAAAVEFSTGKNLYQALWRPDEHGWVFARDISEMLDEGLNILMSDPQKYKAYNPENGWGDYDGLVSFVCRYRNACWGNPDAELRISR
jgi:hypothetical protein